ncbi:hypothetical protein J7E88_15495 [Streptomyces sp. ISL-10]|uniref:hypothetical protein n=1 Tax=Streptomyces sp. ISL-10 TaxID=2819172 RepID=UPI001BEBE743|nr:hypothetical protein [Streptomyces sp. ISL-10]MBT2366677.1 hypothetical protein [Streptomyces sp. ISL-10]
MGNEEAARLWAQLSPAARERVDAEVVGRRRLHAVLALREAFREAGSPAPGLYACQAVVAARGEDLADRLEPLPPPDDVPTLLARAADLPGAPLAFEAEWDGDTQGWIADLYAVLPEPAGRVRIGSFRDGGDLYGRATEAGCALGARFAVPFRFCAGDGPGDGPGDVPAPAG